MPGLAERAGRVGRGYRGLPARKLVLAGRVWGARAGGALQNPESKFLHCSREPKVHCRIQKASLCTAGASRKCIAESRKQACALQARAESALQNPESKLVHCSRGPEEHCRIQKTSLCTAVAGRKSIAETGKQAFAMQSRAGRALQNPESKLLHCSREPEEHCRSRKTSLCTAVAGRKSIAESRKQACALQSRVFVPVDTTKSPCPQSGIHETAPPRGCLSPVQLFSHAYIITAGDSSAILYKCGGPIESQS